MRNPGKRLRGRLAAVTGGFVVTSGTFAPDALGIRRPVRHRVDRWSSAGRLDLASEDTGAGVTKSSPPGWHKSIVIMVYLPLMAAFLLFYGFLFVCAAFQDCL
jgi:hypothetical protein